jgi:hypothetical protein
MKSILPIIKSGIERCYVRGVGGFAVPVFI